MKDVLKRLLRPFDEDPLDSEEVAEIDIEVDENGQANDADVWQIALDVFEVEDGLIIIAPLAGVSQKDLDINLVRNVLTLSGNRKQPDIYEHVTETHVSECFYGPFSRSIILPENLWLNHIRATIERGMLIVTIPHLVIDSKSIKVEQVEGVQE